jgi:hypothetical protein
MVARQKQFGPARAEIAEGKGKHAIQPMNAIRTLLFVKVDYDFRIGVRGKVVAFVLQFTAKFGEVVDFAVVGDPDRAVFVAHWHVPIGRKIKDGKAPAAQANIGTIRESSIPQAEVVGTTVRLDARHPTEHVSVAAICQTADAAHSRLNPPIAAAIRKSWL